MNKCEADANNSICSLAFTNIAQADESLKYSMFCELQAFAIIVSTIIQS